MNKKRNIKPVEILLRRRNGISARKRRDEFDQVHHIHVWKYHNETPLYN
jgi:hypothetical protein